MNDYLATQTSNSAYLNDKTCTVLCYLFLNNGKKPLLSNYF